MELSADEFNSALEMRCSNIWVTPFQSLDIYLVFFCSVIFEVNLWNLLHQFGGSDAMEGGS